MIELQTVHLFSQSRRRFGSEIISHRSRPVPLCLVAITVIVKTNGSFAALIYSVQEGTARLTIVSGLSLGQCLRHKYRATPALADTAVICWLVAASIFLGNLLFECNNFAGGVDAVMAMPGARALPPTGLLGIPHITTAKIPNKHFLIK